MNPNDFDLPRVNPTLARHPDYGRLIADKAAPVSGAPAAHDGLLRDRATGRLTGIEQAPPARHPDAGADYPRWVTPHVSHVVVSHNEGQQSLTGDWPTESDIAGRDHEDDDGKGAKTEGGNVIIPRNSVVSVPGFLHHVRRHDGALQVLVANEEEEHRVTSERDQDEASHPVHRVSDQERWAAEDAYERECAAREAEAREKRVAEIIQERRREALERDERELDERRRRIEEEPQSRSGKSSYGGPFGVTAAAERDDGKIPQGPPDPKQVDDETGKNIPDPPPA